MACDILATPASTAPVEKHFLLVEVTKGKRNRLTDKNLEIFLRRNKSILIRNYIVITVGCFYNLCSMVLIYFSSGSYKMIIDSNTSSNSS